MLDIKEHLVKIALKLTTWINEATHNSIDGFLATAGVWQFVGNLNTEITIPQHAKLVIW